MCTDIVAMDNQVIVATDTAKESDSTMHQHACYIITYLSPAPKVISNSWYIYALIWYHLWARQTDIRWHECNIIIIQKTGNFKSCKSSIKDLMCGYILLH